MSAIEIQKTDLPFFTKGLRVIIPASAEGEILPVSPAKVKWQDDRE
ncbi:hypothetical protein MRS76_10140 [Rhizobiaceae bacterium n13]|uniref:Uncharacterized protein n=1 Tax=Ferirhizobium litorale TaxID=2927786 RepID=A0AAE3U3I1_9HYPH|nr:hypothetical protein [Fererhizobium litorale]MDI7862318.1 hypothetical protein [Fererhizobium litorale]MDI7922408.1 hypothetical protein [Fererhizobium litorale]